MNYIRIDGNEVSIFDVCQAHAQLESDYNMDGWLRERPSNLRRMESTGCQLNRIGYLAPYRWVNICADQDEGDDPDDEDVRYIYLTNVLKWGLPADLEMKRSLKKRFTPEFLAHFPSYQI